MLRKLLIATFVVGLVLTFTGSAISGPTVKDYGEARTTIIPNHPKLSETHTRNVPVFNRLPGLAKRDVTGSPSARPAPPAGFCDVSAYHNGTAFGWPCTGYPAGGGVIAEIATRFTVEAGYACTLFAHWTPILGSWNVAGADPGMVVTLYADDGWGLPGAVLDSWTIPQGSTPTGFSWVGTDMTVNQYHVFGEYGSDVSYIIGVKALTDSPDDTLWVLSDAFDGPFAGEARSSLFHGSIGAWATNLAAYGDDYAWTQEVDRCCYELPFTDCYTQAWHSQPWFIWQMPDIKWGDSAYATRFSTAGPETLVSVDFAILFGGPDPGTPDYIAGDDDVYVTVYGDDGTGLPDPGNVLFSATVTGGTYPAYPALINVPVGLVFPFNTDFHVAISSNNTFIGNGVNGDFEILVGDDGSGAAMGRGSSEWGSGWFSMLNGWGGDYGFIVEANMCTDQFDDCQAVDHSLGNFNGVYPVPDANPIIGWAQNFTAAGEECQLRDVDICLYRSASFDSGRPAMYTTNTAVTVYADAAGAPGAVLATIILTPADYAAAGYTGPGFFGAFEVSLDFSPLVVPTSFFIGVEALTLLREEGIRICFNDGAAPNDGFGGIIAHAPAFGGWANFFGFNSMTMTAVTCCIPFSGRDCAGLLPDPNWNYLSHDDGRTGASGNAIGDSWCDLNVIWEYESPTDRTWYTSASIYNGIVACSFGDHYAVFDGATGAPLYVIDVSTAPAGEIGSGIRCAPLLTTIDSAGTPIDVMFLAGGIARSIQCRTLSTGAIKWNNNYGGIYGNTRYCPFVLLDQAGTEVLYYGDDDGLLHARVALTGAGYGGWLTNPVAIAGGASPNKSLTTDGVNLFYCTAPGAGDGDVYALDAATGGNGIPTWQLATSGGLQGALLWNADPAIDNPPASAEWFRTGISYEAGVLYTASFMSVGEHPTEGAFYRINAGTGGLVGGAATQSMGTFEYGTPIIDLARIYFPGLSKWLTATGPQLICFAKANGAILWTSEGPTQGGYRADGALTCEPEPAIDQLLVFDDEGFFRVVNSETGDEMWRRRVHNSSGGTNNRGMGIAIGTDSSGAVLVTISDFWGNLFGLTKGADRPRLEIQSYRPQVPVEFGFNTALDVSLGPLLTNTGCTDLTINALNVSDVGDDAQIPDFAAMYLPTESVEKAASLAERLTQNLFIGSKNAELANTEDNSLALRRDNELRESLVNKAAAALPAWYNGITSPLPGALLSPGDTIPIVINVDQTQISRGPSLLYIEVDSDDPDFFLQAPFKNPPVLPVIRAMIVGGCLADTATLFFGPIGDFQWAAGAGQIGSDAWNPGAWEINGEGFTIFQGFYAFGVSQRRLALFGSYGGEGPWISWQPDPNWCDNTCKPFLDTATLCAITHDGGLTYDPIAGHRVCASGVDSVQNFDDGGGGWDWELSSIGGGPFDNDSTMGLYVNTRIVGVDNEPGLNNLTLEIFEFYERNNQAIPGWKFGAWYDGDLGFVGATQDTILYDGSVSTAWLASAAGAGDFATVVGFVKLPYGCVDGWDSRPLRNALAMDAVQSIYAAGTAYLDSFYLYSGLAPGAYARHGNVSPQGDQQHHITYTDRDIAAADTFSFGVGMFYLENLATVHGTVPEIQAQSRLMNKWAGFGRGDVNNDDAVNLGDIMYLAAHLGGGPGAIPFAHLSDVNADNVVDNLDLDYLVNYYFNCGPCPSGDWCF